MNYTKQLDLRRRFDEREKKKHQVRINIIIMGSAMMMARE